MQLNGIVLDASAIISVITDEPEGFKVIELTQNSSIICPNIITFEIANSITRMIKKRLILDKNKAIDLVKSFNQIHIQLVKNDIEKIIEIAWKYKIYAYDAFYLETALELNLPLLTFDKEMKKIATNMGIIVLGGQ